MSAYERSLACLLARHTNPMSGVVEHMKCEFILCLVFFFTGSSFVPFQFLVLLLSFPFSVSFFVEA